MRTTAHMGENTQENRFVAPPQIKSADQPARVGLWRYIYHARLSSMIAAPFVYACLPVFLLLDLFASMYQAVCFPLFGIPKVRRSDHLIFDRGRLPYLNLLERLNCIYCSYTNGLASYLVEITGRTEQYWCPIQHSRTPSHPHSRYPKFLPYQHAAAFREHGERVSRDFDDLR